MGLKALRAVRHQRPAVPVTGVSRNVFILDSQSSFPRGYEAEVYDHVIEPLTRAGILPGDLDAALGNDRTDFCHDTRAGGYGGQIDSLRERAWFNMRSSSQKAIGG